MFPKLCMYRIALRNVSVLDVTPSPTPPKSLIDITTFLGGTSRKNPKQLGASSDIPVSPPPNTTHLGKTVLVPIWKQETTRTINTSSRNAHEGLVKPPIAAPNHAFSESILHFRYIKPLKSSNLKFIIYKFRKNKLIENKNWGRKNGVWWDDGWYMYEERKRGGSCLRWNSAHCACLSAPFRKCVVLRFKLRFSPFTSK